MARTVYLVALIWAIPIMASAQPAVAIGGGAGLSSQGAGTADGSLRPALAGSTPAGLVFVDVGVSRWVSLGAELTLGGPVTGHQQQKTATTVADVTTRHYDTLVSAVGKTALIATERMELAAAAGLGVAVRRTHRTGTISSLNLPFTTAPLDSTQANAVPAFTFGLDDAILISPRTALVFSARFHVLNDDDRGSDGLVRTGVGSLAFRFVGGGRVRF